MPCSPPSTFPPARSPAGTFPIDARLDYLVCTNEVCVPEQATVTAELAIGAARDPDPAFRGYRQALPRPLAGEGRFEVAGGRLRLAIPLPAATALAEPYFYPATIEAVRHSDAQIISRSGDILVVEMGAGPRGAARKPWAECSRSPREPGWR